MNTWLSSIDSRCSYSVSQVSAFMFVVHTSICHGQNCTRRAIYRLEIDTLIANILVFSTVECRHPKSQLIRLQQIRNSLAHILSLKLLSPVISLPSYALFTGLESLNASNASSSHLPTKFSQLPKFHSFITSSLFNVFAVLARHLSLLLLGHRHHHPL